MATVDSDTQILKHTVDFNQIQQLITQLLQAIGEDPNRPGLVDTPKRVAKWWTEFIDYDAGCADTSFESITTNQMVIVSGIKVWSLCEHHLLPFWCEISIGYIPTTKVLGLSKFARIAHKHGHKLQLQERLVHDIATEIQQVCQTSNVIVVGKGEHLCMCMRGIKTDAKIVTSVVKGVFLEDGQARQEFLDLIK